MARLDFEQFRAAVGRAAMEGVAPAVGEAAGERPAFAEGYGEARAKLPAFLEGDGKGEFEPPEGYELIELPGGGVKEVRLGSEPGDQATFYLGNVGVIAEREAGGTVRIRFAGFPLPEKLEILGRDESTGEIVTKGSKAVDPRGIQIGLIEDINTNMVIEKAFAYEGVAEGGWTENKFSGNSARIYLPGEIAMRDKEIKVVGLDFWGVSLRLRRSGDRQVIIERLDPTKSLKIAVPARAMLRSAGAGAREEGAREWEAEKPAEVAHMPERAPLPEPQTPEPIPPADSVPETAQQRFSRLVDEVKTQIQDPAVDREAIKGNLLSMFDLAAEITAADPAGEQKLVKGLAVLLRVVKGKEIIFSDKTKGKTAAERRDMVGALVAEAKTLVGQPYTLLPGQRERMAEVMRQLLDHTVALGSGDKMGVSLARLLRIAGGKQVKLGGGK